MEAHIFSYRWSIKALKWFFILGGAVFLVDMIFGVITLFRLADAISGKPDRAFVPVLIFLFIGTVFSYLCILGFNRHPEISIDADGVVVRYFLKKIRVSWENIVKIETLKIPWLSKKKDKFVLTKKFPFWFRVSNIFLYGTFKSGFIINSSIIEYDALNDSIQNRIVAQ